MQFVVVEVSCSVQWPICTIGSRDTAGGQGPRNRHRKCMESADSAVQSQL